MWAWVNALSSTGSFPPTGILNFSCLGSQPHHVLVRIIQNLFLLFCREIQKCIFYGLGGNGSEYPFLIVTGEGREGGLKEFLQSGGRNTTMKRPHIFKGTFRHLQHPFGMFILYGVVGGIGVWVVL